MRSSTAGTKKCWTSQRCYVIVGVESGESWLKSASLHRAWLAHTLPTLSWHQHTSHYLSSLVRDAVEMLSNGAMDKCDAGRSEWTGWWSAMAGIHMFVGILFLVAPADLLPYMGTSSHLTDTESIRLPHQDIHVHIRMHYIIHARTQNKRYSRHAYMNQAHVATVHTVPITRQAVVSRCDLSPPAIGTPYTLRNIQQTGKARWLVMHPFAALVDATEQEWDAISAWAAGALGANLVTVGLLAVWAADPSVSRRRMRSQ